MKPAGAVRASRTHVRMRHSGRGGGHRVFVLEGSTAKTGGRSFDTGVPAGHHEPEETLP